MKYTAAIFSTFLTIASTSACSAAPIDQAGEDTTNSTAERLSEAEPGQMASPVGDVSSKQALLQPSDDPVALVRALYDGRPWTEPVTGGTAIWHVETRPLWESGAQKLVGYDFLTAGPGAAISNLRIEPGDSSDSEAQIIVTFDKGAEKDVTVYFGTIRTDEGWKIAHVWRDDGWNLAEVLGTP